MANVRDIARDGAGVSAIEDHVRGMLHRGDREVPMEWVKFLLDELSEVRRGRNEIDLLKARAASIRSEIAALDVILQGRQSRLLNGGSFMNSNDNTEHSFTCPKCEGHFFGRSGDINNMVTYCHGDYDRAPCGWYSAPGYLLDDESVEEKQ